MLDHLAALVSVETPSEDLAACAAGAEAVSQLAAAVIQESGERPTSRGLIEDAAGEPAPP
jgi:hypothetical protein